MIQYAGIESMQDAGGCRADEAIEKNRCALQARGQDCAAKCRLLETAQRLKKRKRLAHQRLVPTYAALDSGDFARLAIGVGACAGAHPLL